MSQTTPTDVIIGVDTYKDVHAAMAINALGIHLATTTIPASSKGYQALEMRMISLGSIYPIEIEGIGSYGSGLCRFLRRVRSCRARGQSRQPPDATSDGQN